MILSTVLAIVVAVVGWLLKNLISSQKEDIKGIRKDVDDIDKRMSIFDTKIVEVAAKTIYLENIIYKEIDHMKKVQEIRHETVMNTLEDIRKRLN